MEDKASAYWDKCKDLLRGELTESAFRTWFAGIEPLSFENGVLKLQLQSQFVAEYIEENYSSLLGRVLFRVCGPGTRLEYRIPIDSTSGIGITTYSQGVEQEKLLLARPPQSPASVAKQMQEPQLPQLDSRLNPSQTFDSFVQGEVNRMARTVALSVARNPGKTAFNPLFIYGGSGVGKTHLLNAIGNQVKALYPDKRVLYFSANDFKMQYMAASQNNKLADFLGFYQSIDVLLMDDIQFIKNLDRTQEVFFHIFNHLHQSGKQIVLASDKSPLEIKDVDERLITRFKWGFSGELHRPDFSLRRDILKNKVERDGVSLSDEVIDFIAKNVRDNVRDLEGVLASLLAYSTLSDEQISLELAERVVNQLVDVTIATITVNNIMDAVCEEFGVTTEQILSLSRQKEVAQARQVGMYLTRKLLNKPLIEIGNCFGGRTHATVLHAISCVKEEMSVAPVFKRQVTRLESRLVK
ncbi:MAG: chromosomal replication initiator protein DnaA [Bacteroidales bacterium]|jgi:chromosomal replication initiator protein|nr:chromosomal replication initiator protein DnaA [Bacteroidales bacterium]MBR4459884.1 chromosomal replication initiator protein DnaA [Paludibacteraceae bacterium]MBR6145879.1 chromosomal replication initiator protein DnaA [Paludibacteraceae bacterium]